MVSYRWHRGDFAGLQPLRAVHGRGRRSDAQAQQAPGHQILLGLWVGGMVSSMLMASVAFGLGSLLSWVLPTIVRQIVVALFLVGFAVADVINKTPHIWRQVPVGYLHTMPPGRLGVVWGFDLSLLFTTQKATSLSWAALIGTVLLAPEASWLVLCAMTTVGVLVIAARTIWFLLTKPSMHGDRSRPWFRVMRRTAGIALVVAAAYTALGM